MPEVFTLSFRVRHKLTGFVCDESCFRISALPPSTTAIRYAYAYEVFFMYARHASLSRRGSMVHG